MPDGARSKLHGLPVDGGMPRLSWHREYFMPPKNLPKHSRKRPNPKKRAHAKVTRTGRRPAASELMRPPLFRQVEKRTGQLYYDSGLSISAGGAIAYYRFSANGMFDPDVTGTGHQPMGFDTMMEYFDQYVVTRSHITVRFVHSTGEVLPVICGLKLADDTASPSNQEFVENGLGRTGFFAGDASIVQGKYCQCQLSLDCDVMAYFGRHEDEKQFLNDVNMQGTAAANPTEQVYFLIAIWNMNGAVAPEAKLEVKLTYDAVYFEPRKHAVSVSEPRSMLNHKKEEFIRKLKQ